MEMTNIRDRQLRVLASLVLFFLMSGCEDSKKNPAAVTPPAVGIALAVLRDVPDVDDFTGRLEATESVVVRPRVGGYVNAIHFRAGQEVRKGELLVSIDPMTYRADVGRLEGELSAARSKLALAHIEKDRGETLFGKKAISQQERDQLTTALETSSAGVRAAEAALQTASLNLGYTEIRAPIAGRVSRALITQGNLVSAGTSILATIDSLAAVYAYFDVSEAVFLRFSRQARGLLRPPASRPVAIRMGLLNEADYPHTGWIDSFDNRLDAGTGAIRTRAVFDNSGGEFTPGLYARMRLVSGNSSRAVLVPERAVGTDQSKRFVMVVGPDDVASYRNVQLGSLLDGMRVVTQGLKSGERVIVDGLQRVRPGAKVTPEVEPIEERRKSAEGADGSTSVGSGQR